MRLFYSGFMIAVACATFMVACSFVIDTSLEEGFACEIDGRCLPGYFCFDGVCVPDNGDFDPCGGACLDDERCDRQTGTCVPVCQGIVCPTGEVCSVSDGGCIPALEGLGRLCSSDSECNNAITGCSINPDFPGSVLCACIVPATMAHAGNTQGICVGFPTTAGDCSVCGDGDCLDTVFSSAGQTGSPARKNVCVPRGFASCSRLEDCRPDGRGTSVCTYFGWPSDPEKNGWPTGVFAACASKSGSTTEQIGQPCSASNPMSCETGICMPISGASNICSEPCSHQIGGCSDPTSECVDGVVWFGGTRNEPLIWDIAHVCGVGPSLGEPCDPQDEPVLQDCTTDAPDCIDAPMGMGGICSRKCRKDADCTQNGMNLRCSDDEFCVFPTG